MIESALPFAAHDGFKDLVDLSLLSSPIEKEFYRVISKYLHDEVALQNQFPVKTTRGNFLIDFVVTVGSLKIGFECDGKAYHDAEKDEQRDDAILSSGAVHSIVRCRGTDIVFRMDDVLFAIADWYPNIFSERGSGNVVQLASDIARNTEIGYEEAYFVYRRDSEIGIDEDELSNGFGNLYVLRKNRRY